MGSPSDSSARLVDGWHEAWPDPKYCDQIAVSFSEFLERALREGQAYWMNP